MKKWKLLLASALAAIVVSLVPLSAMAQTATTLNAVTPTVIKPDLVIVAPRAVLAGKEMQLTVFERDNQAPVADVNIWAVTKNKIEAFKKNISAVQKDNEAGVAASTNLTGMASYGESLGATDGNGVLKHAFTDNGNYLLVAFKSGFRLDFSALIVRGLPKGLAISNPNLIKLGDKVTITVHQRGASVPVADAEVWAVASDRTANIKGLLSSAQSASKNNPQITDYAAILNDKAISLGKTDADGQIKDYLFDKAGRYILVAFKSGDGLAFSTIAVVAPKPTPTATVNPGARSIPTLSPSTNNHE
jgi:hypothetical protein